MDAEELSLVEKARAGDADSFETLVRKYQDRIYSLAQYVCMNMKCEADDVYQETMISAFKNISRFQAKSSFGTWLHRIALNNCLMKYRKRKSEKLVSLEDIREIRDRAGDETLKRELSHEVAAALSKLSVDFRMAITLADIQGLTMEEAAKTLGVSVGAFKTRLHRARAALKGEFESMGKAG